MHKWEYKAQNSEGKVVKSVTYAMGGKELTAKLKDLDLSVISYRKTIAIGDKVKTRDLIVTMSFLQKMLQIGLPITDVLISLAKSTKHILLKSAILDMYKSVKGGSTMSVVMTRYKKIFNNTTVAIVSAGEKAGGLASALNDAVEYLEWQDKMTKKAKQATIKPGLMISVIISAMMLIIALVVPNVLKILAATDTALPTSTRILLGISEFLQSYILLIILLLIIFIVVYKIMRKKNSNFAIKADYYKTKIPMFGPIIMKLNVAGFCNLFAVCLANHVDIINGLRIAQRVVTNQFILQTVNKIGKTVADGKMLSVAFTRSKFFDPLILKLITIGEESGEFIDSFKKIKEFYDVDVNSTLDSLIAAINPIVTIVTGLLLVFILLSVFGPMYGNMAKAFDGAP